MKKFITLSLALSLFLASTACNSGSDSSSAPSTTASTSEVPSAAEDNTFAQLPVSSPNNPLTCHMTERELNNVRFGELTVFDHEQPPCPVPQKGVAIEVLSKQDLINYWKNYRKEYPDTIMTDEEINTNLANYEKMDDDYQEYGVAFIDGEMSQCQCPPVDYDGGELQVAVTKRTYYKSDDDGNIKYYDENNNEITEEEFNKSEEDSELRTYENFEALKEYIREDVEFACKISEVPVNVDEAYERELKLWEAVINKNFTTLPPGVIKDWFSWKYNTGGAYWEIDHDSVMSIKDYVREYSFYDEQMNKFFTIHVTTPPDYDPGETYPAFVLTDGVWRFNNCPAMRKAMEEGKADGVILISIGLDYAANGMDDENRKAVFCQNSGKFLDFITDDLMPYLGNDYNIDFANSTFFGHSLGGTFSHYAVFNSDKYENQPFHNYIIGSPAFWSPGFLPYVNQKEVLNDYGYFDRNTSLDKHIFVCAGADEDPVYEEYYGDNDSTLEGVDHLMKRLAGHGATDAECMIYPGSGHYQFIPEMLVETLIKFYPAS